MSQIVNVDEMLTCSDNNHMSPLKLTYTAMHGVGYQAILEAFKVFNFTGCIPVKEQVQPDPEFPTVKFPNPEEGKSALVREKQPMFK